MRILPIFAAALVLAACGGASRPRSASHTTPPAQPTKPATTPASTVATSPSVRTATSAARQQAGVQACSAGELTLSYLGGQAATGHGLLGFALRNTSGSACRSYGYPGVLFLGSGGTPLPTLPTHTTEDYFGAVRETPVLLAPGQSASFRLGVSHGSAGGAPCTTAYGLQVIPPNDTATLRVRIPAGAYECRSVTVTPLQDGTSAYP